MQIKNIVPLATVSDTAQLNAAKEFYLRHFGFRISFENESYLGLKAPGASDGELGFMLPDQPQGPSYGGAGMTYCLQVEDVDAEHERLTAAGLEPVMPLGDRPWGDRSFVVQDPVGIHIYIFKPIPPTAEFAASIKE